MYSIAKSIILLSSFVCLPFHSVETFTHVSPPPSASTHMQICTLVLILKNKRAALRSSLRTCRELTSHLYNSIFVSLIYSLVVFSLVLSPVFLASLCFITFITLSSPHRSSSSSSIITLSLSILINFLCFFLFSSIHPFTHTHTLTNVHN